MEEFNFTQEELARRLGRSRPAIANTVRLLSLPQTVKEAVIRGELTAGQARPLLAIPDEAVQKELARQILAKGLTAREAEKLVGRSQVSGKTVPAAADHEPADPLWQELQNNLQRYLGTKVKINRAKNGGTIEIHYYGDDDLDRLLLILLPKGIV
jgi:ParB family chromosome partitioning protein